MFRRDVQDGVFLTLLEERHAPEIFAVVDRERARLREWLPWVDESNSVDDTLDFIRRSLQQFASNDGFSAGIWRGGDFGGVVGFHKIDWLNRKVEIGYWIAQAFEGQGIMSRSCRLLIDHAFEEWKLNRVEIHCAPANAKSCAIPVRLGFEFEGTLKEAQHLRGSYLDSNVYAMLARNWKRAATSSKAR